MVFLFLCLSFFVVCVFFNRYIISFDTSINPYILLNWGIVKYSFIHSFIHSFMPSFIC